GGRTAEAKQMQLREATPLADQLERLTNQLVNEAEADMVSGIEASTQSYGTAQWIVMAFALGSIALALGLGYAISWSLVGPVKEIEQRLKQVAAGGLRAARQCGQPRRAGGLGDRCQSDVRGTWPALSAT